MPTHERCPEIDQLLAFQRGDLDTETLEILGRHLLACAPCETRLVLLEEADGGIVANLRRYADCEEKIDLRAVERLEAMAIAIPVTAPEAVTGPQGEFMAKAPREPFPARLGQYLLLEELGHGGMGAVYAALHLHLKKRVAVKVILPDYAEDLGVVARFLRETEAIGALAHPNVVAATDAGEAEGRPFLVMELVDGLDLSSLLRRTGPLAVADACEIGRQAAVGLQYVHEQGRVHRDLKPSNLMLTADGVVKILDLGLAGVFVGRLPAGELTPRNQAMGTADYMAPEQWADSHNADVRADLYSLGCTLYKLLTGAPPFAGPGHRAAAEKMMAHLREPPPPMSLRRPDVPAALVAVLERLMAKLPTDRFPVPAEAARALEPFCISAGLPALLTRARAKQVSEEATPLPSPHMENVPTCPSARNFPWARAAVAALVLSLIVAGLGIYFARRGDGPTAGPTMEVAWPAGYPGELRDRPWGRRLDLLRPAEQKDGPQDPARSTVSIPRPAGPDLRYQPAWCRRLAGTGQYHPLRAEMTLSSSFPKPNRGCTALALDDDRALRWFEFEAELLSTRYLTPVPHFGAFFGWRAAEGGWVSAYFVHLDDTPRSPQGPTNGQVTVGHLLLPRSAADADPADVALDPSLAKTLGTAPLTQQRQRYRLRVGAMPGKVTVAVDDEILISFAPAFEPRGALGVWVQNGKASFSSATVTALPNEAGDP